MLSSERVETPQPAAHPLLTGDFAEAATYATWRTHGTSDYLLMFTRAGAGRVGWASGETLVRSGDVVCLRPHTPHDYGTAAPPWEFYWAHFTPRPHWIGWLAWPEIAPGIHLLSLGDDLVVCERVEKALMEMHRRVSATAQPRRADFGLHALEEALLWCDTKNPRSPQVPLDDRVARAMEFLLSHLAEPVGIADAARACHLSASHLSHLFHAHTGQTLQQFQEAERMTLAQQLLALTQRSVGDVARAVGYENPFYFTLRFKKRTGLSPTEWRRNQGVPAQAPRGS